MKTTGKIHLLLILIISFMKCENEPVENKKDIIDYSGVYCLNLQNLEMTIVQTRDSVSFALQSDLLKDGVGKVSGNILNLTAITNDFQYFSSALSFSEDKQSFTGPFELADATGNISLEGILLGDKGKCSTYDIESYGIPEFVIADFT